MSYYLKMNNLRNQSIEDLRFICACMVVLIHAIALPSHTTLSLENGIYDTIYIIISEGICVVAVPIFFLISGYCFFKTMGNWRWDVWMHKMKRRLRALLLPYVVWNLISMLFTSCLMYMGYMGGGDFNALDWFNEKGGILAFWDCGNGGRPINYPLWFIRDLIVLDLFTPLIFWLIKHTQFISVLALFLLYISRVWIDKPGLCAEAFLFFILGCYLGINKYDFTGFFKKKWPYSGIVALPLLITMCFFYDNELIYGYTRRCFTLSGVFFIIGFVAYLRSLRVLIINQLLVDSSFLIYVAHATIVLPLFEWTLYRILPANTDFAMVAKYLVASIATILVIILCYSLMAKYSPKLLAFLVGKK